MSMNELFNLGGGPLQVSPRYFVTTSRTLVAPFAGKMLVRAVAAGGSGARPSAGGNATGGGAGEYAEDIVSVAAGDTFTLTIPAGGLAVAVANTVGNDGGDLTISGPASYALVLKGGKGGAKAASGPVSGGAGGTGGTGGSTKVVRAPGGRAGNVTGAAATNKATGGGAVNLNFLTAQTATRGGDISKNDALGQFSGGGGVNGHGGDIVAAVSIATGGGGSGNDGTTDANTRGKNYLQEDAVAAPTSLVAAAITQLPISPCGGGGVGNTGAAGEAGGAGGGGGAGSGTGSGSIGGDGGQFGGGGASNGGASSFAGSGKLGGGGGAALAGTTGAGDKGWADIQFVRVA